MPRKSIFDVVSLMLIHDVEIFVIAFLNCLIILGDLFSTTVIYVSKPFSRYRR